MPDAQLCVIGGGPAGTAAALRAAHLGAEVVVVEHKRLGGAGHRGAVCLAGMPRRQMRGAGV